MTYENTQIRRDTVTKRNRTSTKESINVRLFLCALSADLLMVEIGAIMAWVGPVLPMLRSNNTEINPLGKPITTLQSSFISAIPLASLVFGTFLAAKVSVIFGRRQILIYCAMGTIFFLCILAFSSNIYLYYVSLFLSGLLLDGIYMNVFMYNNEISEKCNRGKLSCAGGLCWTIGTFYTCLIGAFSSVRMLTLFCCLPAVLHLLLSPLLVETPAFLASKGKRLEALQSLEILRRHKTGREVEIEYELIEKTQRHNANVRGKFADLFKTKASKRATFISITMQVTQQISGVLIIAFHIPIIFQDADVKIPGNIVAIFINFIQMLIFFVPTFLIDRIGKRPLLLFSSAFCSMTMFCLALFFYLKHLEIPIVDGIEWVPVACAILFISGHCIGLSPLPLIIVSELFPTEIKPVGLGTTLIIGEFIMMSVVFTYPLISELFGIYCCMWSYSAFTLIGCIVLYFILPETKGKTLLEIQDILSS